MHPWDNTALSAKERAQLLVSAMSLEEKISQMSYTSVAIERLGIPAYNWWNEALHGVARSGSATVFPQSIGAAASFDPALLQKEAEIIGKEARLKYTSYAALGDRGIYKGLTMWSPNINIFRDPRWGRGHETYGEDPYLTSRMGVHFIEGLQGADPEHPVVDATAKHFAVHSGPEADRHHFDARASRKDMNLTYLPAFEAAIKEARVHAVMGAYNRVNGEAACASGTLLQDILRREWGFEGYVVSDCGAVEDIYQHHQVVSSRAEAAALAVKNGCDLCCGMIYPCLLEAVEKGLLSEEDIDRSVLRLMTARFRLGSLDPVESLSDEAYLELDSEAHHALSLSMARASMVLLKNEGLLPLRREALHTVAVIGPNADSRKALVGNYNGTPSESYTVLEGIRRLLPDARVLYAEGCPITGGSPEKSWGEADDYRIAEAVQAARLSDVVILVLGLNGEMESEESAESAGSGDKIDLELPASQRALAKAIAETGKPTVLVNMTGSAVVFPCAESMQAILQAWYPGQMGGIAVAETLLGDVSPAGKLPVTFYSDTRQLPDFGIYDMHGRTYRYFTGTPAYPFGFGLSYEKIELKALEAEKQENGDVRVTVQAVNPCDRAAHETVQLYMQWVQPVSEMPLRQLAGFERICLAPREVRKLTFTVSRKAMRVCQDDGTFVDHAGSMRFFVGTVQPDARSAELTDTTPLMTEVTI